MLLTDGYIANGSEPWRIPKYADLPKIEIKHPGPPSNGDTFLPYSATSGWPAPGPSPARRAWSTASAAWKSRTSPATSATTRPTTSTWSTRGPEKVANIANDIPPQKLDGPASGDLLVLSWGGTYGACATAVHNVQAKGKSGHPLPPAVPQSAAEGPGRHPEALQEGADSRAEPGPAADDHPRPVTWSMRSASTRCKASRSAWPKWSRRSKSVLRGDTTDTASQARTDRHGSDGESDAARRWRTAVKTNDRNVINANRS